MLFSPQTQASPVATITLNCNLKLEGCGASALHSFERTSGTKAVVGLELEVPAPPPSADCLA